MTCQLAEGINTASVAREWLFVAELMGCWYCALRMVLRRRTWIIIAVVVVVIVALIIWRVQVSKNSNEPRTVTVEPRTVVQDVVFTGRVHAGKEADLAFAVTGTVDEILVDVGSQVTTGQVLARLNTTATALEVAEAAATTASQQLLAKMTWDKAELDWKGTVSENDKIIAKQRQTVLDAKAELAQADELVHRTSAESGDDSAAEASAASTRTVKQSAYNAAQKTLTQIRQTATNENAVSRAAADLARAEYVATTQAAEGISGLSVVEAREAQARESLRRTSLTVPFAGVITSKDMEIGDVAAAGSRVFGVQTTDHSKLLARVPESDVVKLVIDQIADVTFDAYPAAPARPARVVNIAPAALLVEGVPTYEVTLLLQESDATILPGLTANITVHAASRSDVLAVPRRAILHRNSAQFVQLIGADGAMREVEVMTGLLGSDGFIEITSGLSRGDVVSITPS